MILWILAVETGNIADKTTLPLGVIPGDKPCLAVAEGHQAVKNLTGYHIEYRNALKIGGTKGLKSHILINTLSYGVNDADNNIFDLVFFTGKLCRFFQFFFVEQTADFSKSFRGGVIAFFNLSATPE